MQNKNKNKNKDGYTLIETMIAISLFLVIVIAGMGALLNANLLHNKSKDMRSIMDNLSFVMDDMSRNLRTGYNYYCISGGSAETLLGANTLTPLSGQNCWGIAFEPSGPSSAPQWAYEIISTNTIIKSTDGGATWVQLTPSEVAINTASSYFSIVGAEPPPDIQQPFVTIHLVGTILTTTSFSLQTSVSQRQIDT
jgi:prepilin-type N-terminal cleavage/methylation domain-containing protein